jgi:hypothetical protein
MKTITLTRSDGTVLFVNPDTIGLFYDSKQANTAAPGATLTCVSRGAQNRPVRGA